MEFKIANENKNYDNVEDKKKNINNDEFKKKMKKMAIYIMGGFVILMVILAIMSIFTKKSYSYDYIETILKNSAIDYFSDHKKKSCLLPEPYLFPDAPLLLRSFVQLHYEPDTFPHFRHFYLPWLLSARHP